jgi:hypothetical protein
VATFCENTNITTKVKAEKVNVNITSFREALKEILVYAGTKENIVIYTDIVLSICATTITILSNNQIIIESGTLCDLSMLKITEECNSTEGRVFRALTLTNNKDAELIKALNGLDKCYRTAEIDKLEKELTTQK